MKGYPLSAFLSHALVAFTIEFDNEFERRMPHRTSSGTPGDSPGGPWHASMVMWSNFMRLLPERGLRLRELEGPARMTNLDGLERWGYVTVEPDPDDPLTKAPRRDWMVRPTSAGLQAQKVWGALAGEIEQRWRTRFGEDEIEALRGSLQGILERVDILLPHYLPVVAHATVTTLPPPYGSERAHDDSVADLDLSALLSQTLLVFTLDFEREAPVSLPMSANFLRVIDDGGVRLRDLPRLSGVSKEAISMATGFLEKRGYITIERDPTGPRMKVARLTPSGREAREIYHRLMQEIEARWRSRFGNSTISTLRQTLEQLVGEPTSAHSPLFRGLEPPPDGWRASLRAPDMLPHYPMVLHRGGFPDGS